MKKYTTAKLEGRYQLLEINGSDGDAANARDIKQLADYCKHVDRLNGKGQPSIEHWDSVKLRKHYGDELLEGLSHREVMDLAEIRRTLLSALNSIEKSQS